MPITPKKMESRGRFVRRFLASSDHRTLSPRERVAKAHEAFDSAKSGGDSCKCGGSCKDCQEHAQDKADAPIPVLRNEATVKAESLTPSPARPGAPNHFRQFLSEYRKNGCIRTLDGKTIKGRKAACKYAYSEAKRLRGVAREGILLSGMSQKSLATKADGVEAVPVDAIEQAARETVGGKKGKVVIHGIPVRIENPRGSVRRGVDKNGKAWAVKLAHHYGEIARTEGKDADPVDCFIGPNPESETVFVIDQIDPHTKQYDEAKVMLGFRNELEARDGYLASYNVGWQGLGDITTLTLPEFREWLVRREGDKPISPRLRLTEPIELSVTKKSMAAPMSAIGQQNGGALVPPPQRGFASTHKHIVKIGPNKFRLYSRKKNPKTGKRKNLGTFSSRAAALKHERAVEYFKHASMEDATEKSDAEERAKMHKVTKEFSEGKLKTRGGRTVTDRQQAIAIGMKESGQSNQKSGCALEEKSESASTRQSNEEHQKGSRWRRIMEAYKRGTLKTKAGHPVTSMKEALAVAFSEQRASEAAHGRPVASKKKCDDGDMTTKAMDRKTAAGHARPVSDRFHSGIHPMPVGSKVKARQAIYIPHSSGKGFSFEAGSQEDLEVVKHEPTGIRVRNSKGQEAVIARPKLRGKTTGKGHKLPANRGSEEPESRHASGTCKPGQRADLTGCTSAKSGSTVTRKSATVSPDTPEATVPPDTVGTCRSQPGHPCNACCTCTRCRSAECRVTYTVPATPRLTLKRAEADSTLDLPERRGLVHRNKRNEIETDDDRMTASGILATSDRDRQGDIIECRGVEFEDHKLNPVSLWDHGKWGGFPIGITEDEDGVYTVKYLPDKDIIVQTTHFAQSYPIARQIYALVRDRIIRASSIAVKDIEVEPLPADPDQGHFQKRDADGRRVPFKHILRSALAEVTWTSLPANPDAVMSLLASNRIDDGGFNRVELDPLIRKSLLWHVPRRSVWTSGAVFEDGITRKSMTGTAKCAGATPRWQAMLADHRTRKAMTRRCMEGENRGKPGPCPTGQRGSRDRAEPSNSVQKESSEDALANPPEDTLAKAKFGKSKAEVYYGGKGKKYQEEVDKHFRELLGTDDAETIASLVGAPDDAEVTIDSAHSGKLVIEVEHAAFKAKRYVLRGEDGRPYLENAEFWVKEGKQGAGLGAEVFGRQVENAIEAGIAQIRCHAAKDNPRDPKKPHNGYYTWPRFGYDQSIDDFDEDDPEEAVVKTAIRKKFPEAESVLDVMMTSEGREWWKTHGTDLFHATFDLSEGSRSRRVFDAYLEERSRRPAGQTAKRGGAGMTQKSDTSRKNPSFPTDGIVDEDSHVEEIELSKEDEAALDRAWEKLQGE